MSRTEPRTSRQPTALPMTIILILVVAILLTLSAPHQLGPLWLPPPLVPNGTATVTPGCVVPQAVTFAVIGDYGACTIDPESCEQEAAVAYSILNSDSHPDFVVTVGDNNYLHGDAGPSNHPPPSGSNGAHIANNNSRVYRLEDFTGDHPTLPPPNTPGTVGDRAWPPRPPEFPPIPTISAGVPLYDTFTDARAFFVAMGNHDWHQPHAQPAKDYFEQTGVGESHEFGPVAIFVVETNGLIDGDANIATADLPSLDDQIDDLASLINNSPACWKLLYMHHSPYSVSNAHRMGDTQADLATFINALRTATHNKIDVVLSGHHHAFEYMAEPTATPSGPTPQIRYVTDGKGGSSDRHTLAPPVSGVVSVYSDSDPEHRGWLLVQAWTGQAAPSNLRLTYNVVQRKSRLTPGPTPADWRDRWLSGTVMLVDEAKNCYDHPLTCSSGPCTPGTEEPVATSCTPSYPSSCGGADELHVDAKHPFACPTEVQLIQAHVEAAACCDEPTCPDDTSPCPVKAEGYDAAGHMVAAYCMAQQTVTHRYRVDTGRVFDKWTVPAYWRIIRNDTAWHPQCDPYLQMVWYSCCDCTRNYDID